MKMDLLTEELENLQEKPTISARSRWMARDTKPLSQRVYEVIKDHDLLMRNVQAVVIESEENRGSHPARPPLTKKEADLVAKGLLQRGKDASHRQERRKREAEKEEMSHMRAKPEISARSREIVASKPRQGSTFDRLSRTQTMASLQKQSPPKPKRTTCHRPASARATGRPKTTPFGSTGSRDLDSMPSRTENKTKANAAACLATERMYRQGLTKKFARDMHIVNELRARGCDNAEGLLSTGGQGVYRCWQ